MGENIVNSSFIILESVQHWMGSGLSGLWVETSLTPLMNKSQANVAYILVIFIHNCIKKVLRCQEYRCKICRVPWN